MAILLDEKVVEALPPPATGNKITYDTEVKGFGVRVTSSGARSFILNYRAGGVERRFTIGSFPDWPVKAKRGSPANTGARERARELKRRIDMGEDPMGDRHADRAAPTIDTLADRFDREHIVKRRPATQVDYRSILKLYIRPRLGKMKVADLRHADVEALHAAVAAKAPYRANRTISVLSKMMSLAIKWEMRTDNPARGIERAPEEKRERYLSPAEIARLGEALAGLKEEASANAIRLLLLTGARKGEVLKARWGEFDLAAGTWTKPSAHVKQKKDHRVPLSVPARELLGKMHTADKPVPADLLFEGAPGKPLSDIRESWAAACETAKLGTMVDGKDKAGARVSVFKADARLHDLRHTYASILVSSGLGLPVIGALLGHTQAQTTHRYAHLMDDPLREATERVGRIVSPVKTEVAA